MAYQETTTTGYGQRVGNSFRGILPGLLLFLAGTALLWWNEGRAVKTDKMLKEAEGVTVKMESIDRVDPQFDGKLVYATGLATTADSLIDSDFGIGAKAIKMKRKVEYYQWVEHQSSQSRDKLGGKQETVTTYTYERRWTPSPVESARFRDPAYQQKNYVLKTVEEQSLRAESVSFGAYTLNDSQVNAIWGDVPVELQIDEKRLGDWDKEVGKAYERRHPRTVAKAPVKVVEVPDTAAADTLPPDAPNKVDLEYVHVNGNVVYYGLTPGSPEVGDVRVTFNKVMPGQVTIIAKASGNTFTSFKAKNGKTFSTLQMGQRDLDEIYEGEHQGNSIFLWILRIVGILMVISGLKGIFGIIAMLLKVIPFLSNIVGWGVNLVCSVLGFVWSLLIIAIAWLFYRPLIVVGLLAVAGAITWFFVSRGKGKKA
jgi:hypothetical protein